MIRSPKALFLGLILALCALPLACAQTAIGTWSGLDKSNFQGQLRYVSLTLRDATPEQSAILPTRSPYLPATLEKQILAGELVSSIPNLRRGQKHSETKNVIAAYFPSTQSLVFYFYFGTRANPLTAQIGVLDPDSPTLAFFHTGMAARNGLPYLLARGDKVPSKLEKLAGLKGGIGLKMPANPFNAAQAIQQQKAAQRAAQEAQKAQQAALKKYLPKLQEMQQAMIAAATAGDREGAQEIRLQMQELAQTVAAIQRGEIPADSGISMPKAGSSCPEKFLNWTAEVDANGDQHQNYEGLPRVANLFRDEYFVPHFKKPFADFGKQEAMGVARSFQARCLVPNTPLYHSKIATSLSGAFMDGRGFGRFDAASAALALDLLVRWQNHLTESLKSSGSLAEAEAFEIQRLAITKALWPREQEEATQAMALTLFTKIKAEIFSQLTPILSRLKNSDTNALQELARMTNSALYKKVGPDFIADFEKELWQQADPVLKTYLQSQLQNFASETSPRKILESGRQWYRAASYSLATISNRAPYQSFVKEFSLQREKAYQENKDAFAAELEAIADRETALAFANSFFIPLDNASSPSWRALKAQQENRIRKIDWEAHLARVGDGPFDPNYPGAIYLNAIYRGDTATLASEDKIFQQKFLELLRPLFADGMLDSLGQLFTGGLVEDFKLSNLFLSEIKERTVLDPLTAYFVVNHYDAFPQCRDPYPVQIPVTTIWYTVRRWGDGSSVRSEDSRNTKIFLVNRRHEAAWRKFEGEASSPESLRLINLLGNFLAPQSKDLNIYSSLADTLEGLRRAMSAYPCDHDVLTTLEANMLLISAGRPPIRLAQARTSWKNQ